MIIEINIPGAGESVTEAAIGNWIVEDGSFVEKDQEIAEVETDKATLPLIATESGKIAIIAKAGNKVKIGDIACTIDTGVTSGQPKRKDSSKSAKPSASLASAAPIEYINPQTVERSQLATSKPAEETISVSKNEHNQVRFTPLAKTIMNQNEMDIEDIINGLKKITKHDVERVIQAQAPENSDFGKTITPADRAAKVDRNPMSPLRRKLSKRLVAVKNETAMLTTFNEIDMSGVLEIRKKYQTSFQEKYGQKLGLVSFFTMACTKALQLFPKVNSFLDGDEIVTPHFVDIAIAVQTDKGLMVPVIRNTETKSLAQMELSINELAQKARAARLSIEEMTGGTFTITNGGIFGSMLSTPILNPPQSAILGMHNIVERPVVVKGKIEIRPIMYAALSYDHRLIDGSESVSFLVKVKEMIENPVNLVIGTDAEKILLGL